MVIDHGLWDPSALLRRGLEIDMGISISLTDRQQDVVLPQAFHLNGLSKVYPNLLNFCNCNILGHDL